MFKSKATKELENKLFSLKQIRKTNLDRINGLIEDYRAAAAFDRDERWEYLQSRDTDINKMDEYGRRGWELISTASYEMTSRAPTAYDGGSVMTHVLHTFKRKLVEVPASTFTDASVDINAVKKIDAQIIQIENQLT